MNGMIIITPRARGGYMVQVGEKHMGALQRDEVLWAVACALQGSVLPYGSGRSIDELEDAARGNSSPAIEAA